MWTLRCADWPACAGCSSKSEKTSNLSRILLPVRGPVGSGPERVNERFRAGPTFRSHHQSVSKRACFDGTESVIASITKSAGHSRTANGTLQCASAPVPRGLLRDAAG